MRYILALDQGTTSSRAILFDRHGSIAGVSQRELPMRFPRSGWVEQDPREIWQTQLQVAEQVLHVVGADVREIAGIGIANQRETTVLWDRATGAPVHPAIVWQDRRTAEDCHSLVEQGLGDRVRAHTGLVIDPYFSGTKLSWLLRHVSGARERAERGELAFGTVDSWLLWNLTGGRVHATDATNASRTLLSNLRTGGWDPVMLQTFGVPAAILPEIRDTSGKFGEVRCGSVLDGLPILAMAGDQHAALFGQACFAPGMAKSTYGTGCFILLYTGDRVVDSRHDLLSTLAWQIDGKRAYALEGSVFIGGAVVQWLRDQMGIIDHASEIEALANEVPDSGGLYFIPAFAGLGAPHWDASARGLLIGMTRGTTKAHLARAALESIAYQCSDVLETMRRETPFPLRDLRVDGGAVENNLLMQFQADLMQTPVVRPEVTETTALGAAGLAGLAARFWSGIDAFAQEWSVNRTFEPSIEAERAQALRAGWTRALERCKHWEEA